MYFVYLMASQRNGTLYCGVTNDLLRRAYEHREGLVGASQSAMASNALSGSSLMTVLNTPFSARNASRIIHVSGRSI